MKLRMFWYTAGSRKAHYTRTEDGQDVESGMVEGDTYDWMLKWLRDEFTVRETSFGLDCVKIVE